MQAVAAAPIAVAWSVTRAGRRPAADFAREPWL